MEEGNRRIIIFESIVCNSRERNIKIESEALVSTSDFLPVLAKSTVSWERSVSRDRLCESESC